MYTVLNADIPVIYVGVSVCIHVKYVLGHSVKGENCEDINAYIVVSALMFVMCVIRDSVTTVVS
jgi:hypothetical protein